MKSRQGHQTGLNGVRWAHVHLNVLWEGWTEAWTLTWFPNGNEESTSAPRWLHRTTAKNRWDHVCKLLWRYLRSSNRVQHLPSSRLILHLKVGTSSFPSNLSHPLEPLMELNAFMKWQTKCMHEMARWLPEAPGLHHNPPELSVILTMSLDGFSLAETDWRSYLHTWTTQTNGNISSDLVNQSHLLS